MIDTIGSGIPRMFKTQRDRFFPMPDFDLSEPNRVKVRLYGKILDENYTRLLMKNTTLDLMDVIALDKVQKQKPISDEEIKHLRKQKLIEGRKTNLFVSAKVAAATGKKSDYIKHRGFDKDYYKSMVLSYLEKFNEANREDIDKLLLDKLPDVLTPQQKNNRIKNILQELKNERRIVAKGARKTAKWVLLDKE